MGLFLYLNPQNESLEHPDSSVAEQKKFIKHLNALRDVVKEGTFVNPFNETSSELITLDTGEVMDPAIVVCLKNAPTIGKNMFTEFVTDIIEEASKPLSDVIEKPNLYTFSNRPLADLKKDADKLGSAKANAALVTKLLLSLQARPEADIDAFFKHENQREPPSDRGKLRQGTKSDSIACLPGMPAPGRSKAVKEATVVILDMTAVIHNIKPQRARIYGEYTHMQLLPYMQSQMTDNTSRVDAIWDTQQEASLKSQTRAKRGESSSRRTRVSAKGVEWQKFLKDNKNKDELF